MKKFSLLKLFSITAFAMAGALAVANAKGSKKAESVKADTYSGSVIIQKNDNDAKWDGCSMVAYFFDNDSHNGWGSKVANTSNKYQVYTWDLSFDPTSIIVLRVDKDWSESDPWHWFSRTGNVTLATTDVIWMNGDSQEGDSGSKWGTYTVDAVIKGGASDTWSSPTVDQKLSNYKINGSGNLEAYGSVSLPANTYFKAVKTGSTWIGAYTAHTSIQSNLENSEAGNIHNTAAASYEFYFDYDAETLYITDPIRAAADEWAQEFLSVNCVATMAQWSVQGARFGAMDSGAKALFVAEPHIDHKAEATSYIAQAVQRYDYVIQRYGTGTYTDFMGRIDAGKISAGSLSYLDANYTNNNPTNLIVIVSIVSLISASTLVGLIVIKKRKSISK